MSVDSSDSSIACSRKPTIVFVDDEPLLLESLRGNFRKFASQWDLHFIVGGPRALDALQELSVDVILTDLKMPEVDGCEVMQHAMKHAPQAARFMVSGHFDDAPGTALTLAHQFFVKPTNAAQLHQAISRVLGGCIRFPDIRERGVLATAASNLCKVASVAEINRALARDAIDFDALARLVKREPVLAARLVCWANAWVDGRTRVTTVADALRATHPERIRLLLRALVEASELLQTDLVSPIPGDHHERVGRIAAIMMAELAPERVEEAFLGGLVHDIGSLAMPRLGYHDAQRTGVAGDGRGPDEAPIELHARCGAQLLELWGIEETTVSAIWHHHCPQLAPPNARDLAAIIYLADEAVQNWEADGSDGFAHIAEASWIDQLGLRDFVNRWPEAAAFLLEDAA